MAPERESGLRDRLYAAATSAVAAAAPLARTVRPAWADQLAGRAEVPAALEAWAATSAAASAPRRPGPLWVHGASAGELLGAEPVVRALRTRWPEGEPEVVVTYFSPSGRGAASRLEPDWHGHPPLDAPGPCRRALAAVDPAALVFAKLDVWPGLVRAAAERGVPTALVNGTVRPGSSRLRAPARWLLAPTYARLSRVGAASADDAERLRRLGARREAVRVTGDAAFELALRRAEAAGAGEARARLDAILGSPGGGRPRLVAGSTWPADEEVLLAAAGRLAARGRALDLVVAPHEPTEDHVRGLCRRVRESLGTEALRWSEAPAPAAVGDGPGRDGPPGGREAPAAAGAPVRVLVVDAVGVLAELYTGAALAYVGGGFGDDGLHSVVEPAAAGVPVLFGPRHERREAAELLRRGAARAIAGAVGPGRGGGAGGASAGPPADAEGGAGAVAAAVVEALLDSEGERRRMGAAGRAYVEGGAGAALAGAELVLELVRGR